MNEPINTLSDRAKDLFEEKLGASMERTLEAKWATFWAKVLEEMARRANPPPDDALATMKRMMRGAYLEGFYDGGIASLNHATRFRETLLAAIKEVDSPGPPPV